MKIRAERGGVGRGAGGGGGGASLSLKIQAGGDLAGRKNRAEGAVKKSCHPTAIWIFSGIPILLRLHEI